MNSFLAISCVFICFASTIAFVKNDPQLWSHSFTQGETSYLISTVKMNFEDAIDYCKTSNFQLAAIENEAENKKIFNKLSYLGFLIDPNALWTSGTKLAKSNDWIWLTQMKFVTFFNWGTKQPSFTYGNENCIAAHPSGNQDGTGYWISYNCSSLALALCETVSSN